MYFTLLYSVATGLFTSTLRILTAITLTLLVKPRLDRLVFISPFQKLDTGEKNILFQCTGTLHMYDC